MFRFTLIQSLLGRFVLFAFAVAAFSLVHGDTESRKDNSVFDIDESGDVQPLTDGLMILRSMFGFTGDSLTSGAVDLSNCVECTPEEIAQYISFVNALNYGQLSSSDDQNISGSSLSGTTLTIGIEGGNSETVDLASLIEGLGLTTDQAAAIVANTAKTGITIEQANAIVVNTAKTGITADQAAAITANTAKTGITTEQASAIEANTAKASTDDQNISGSGLSGTTLTIGIEGGNSETVNLSGLQDGTGTDDQNISGSGLSGTTLTIGIEGGNSETVNLSGLQDGTGTDDQNISGSGLSGTTLTIGIEGGNSEAVNLHSLQGATSVSGLSDALVEDNSYYIGNDPSSTTSTAERNLAVGGTALDAVTTGDNNVGVGYNALSANTTGPSNTALGSGALQANTSGDGNTASGYYALANNTTGRLNSGFGYRALTANTSGEANVATGQEAMSSNTTGMYNVGVGFRGLELNTTGWGNVAVGFEALDANTTGTTNTAIGASADVGSNNLTNATAIGYQASVAASNTIQLGNTSVTNVKTSGSLTTGAITIPNTDGTADQVLKTDGSGTLSWTSNTDTSAIRSAIQTVTNQVTNNSEVIASCPSGTVVIGGGCFGSSLHGIIRNSYNNSNTWVCNFSFIGIGLQPSDTITASAICL